MGTIWAPSRHRDLRSPLGIEMRGGAVKTYALHGAARLGHRQTRSMYLIWRA